MQFEQREFDCAQRVFYQAQSASMLPIQLHSDVQSLLDDLQRAGSGSQAGLSTSGSRTAGALLKTSPASGSQVSPRIHPHAKHIARLLADLKDAETSEQVVVKDPLIQHPLPGFPLLPQSFQGGPVRMHSTPEALHGTTTDLLLNSGIQGRGSDSGTQQGQQSRSPSPHHSANSADSSHGGADTRPLNSAPPGTQRAASVPNDLLPTLLHAPPSAPLPMNRMPFAAIQPPQPTAELFPHAPSSWGFGQAAAPPLFLGSAAAVQPQGTGAASQPGWVMAELQVAVAAAAAAAAPPGLPPLPVPGKDLAPLRTRTSSRVIRPPQPLLPESPPSRRTTSGSGRSSQPKKQPFKPKPVAAVSFEPVSEPSVEVDTGMISYGSLADLSKALEYIIPNTRGVHATIPDGYRARRYVELHDDPNYLVVTYEQPKHNHPPPVQYALDDFVEVLREAGYEPAEPWQVKAKNPKTATSKGPKPADSVRQDSIPRSTRNAHSYEESPFADDVAEDEEPQEGAEAPLQAAGASEDGLLPMPPRAASALQSMDRMSDGTFDGSRRGSQEGTSRLARSSLHTSLSEGKLPIDMPEQAFTGAQRRPPRGTAALVPKELTSSGRKRSRLQMSTSLDAMVEESEAEIPRRARSDFIPGASVCDDALLLMSFSQGVQGARARW